MSFLARPGVVFAIVFGCFAVLVPRIFIPLFRSKPAAPSDNMDDRFRRPPGAVPRDNHGDSVEHVQGTPPHMRGAHPGMRMHHPGANHPQPGSSDHGSSKSIVTLALPMYTVGIGIFFIYTCCKYWSKKNCDEPSGHSKQLRLNREKRKLGYDILDKDSEEDDDNKQDLYAGLDSDYVEYLKTKKQKALEAERAMTDEQKQMHYALEEMKKSLSFISSKLVTKENRTNLHGNEITQLQDRLMSTEAQMCKILSALDVASDKVSKLSQDKKKPPKVDDDEEPEDESLTSSDEEDETDDKSDQRQQSDPLSSGDSSHEDDQSAPADEQNHLVQRKVH